MKTLRWLIVFVAAAIITYWLLSASGGRADRNTQITTVPDRTTARRSTAPY